ncbi:MAG: hypothetical protein GC185_10745 [Alphaproteobacteria bacterium]|nr:hypothetical protein [Alphaproteobacteria bacterium]
MRVRLPVLSRFFVRLFTAGAIFCLAGCAGTLPGGTQTVNKNYYPSPEVLKSWVDTLEPGMSKGEVFTRLGRSEEDFRRLDRTEIVDALFGGNNAGVPAGFMPPEQIRAFLNSLAGYELDYKYVKKRHGFTSPIRIRTDANGFDYMVKLIFKNGVLLEKPVMTGALVHNYSSDTLFDFLSPGIVVDKAIP